MRSTNPCPKGAVLLVLLTTLLNSAKVFPEAFEEQFKRCQTIADETARLACYDGLATAREPRVNNEGTIEEPRKSEAVSGSAATAATAQFGKEHWRDSPDSLETIESKVSAVQKGARGQVILLLANDQVWEQKDARRLSIREGDTVIIERGSMNSFFIREKGASRQERFSRVR